MIDLVRRLCRETQHHGVLFSAHELNQLLGALDRVLYLGSGQAALGTVDGGDHATVLSRLYGAEIEVVRADGHIFVLSARPRGRAPARTDSTSHDHHHPPSACSTTTSW